MNDQDAIALLRRMVEIPSLSGDERSIATFLVSTMERLGFDARIDEAGNAVGVIGDGPTTGVLLGHMDTVAGEIPVRVEDGKLYGRGSVDAKGPLAAFIAGATRAHAAGTLAARIVVVGCVEEEAPSSKGARHVTPHLNPDWCVNGEPSGWDGITLGYKGFLRAHLRWSQGSAHSAHAARTVCERAVRGWSRIESAVRDFNEGRERLFDQLLPALVGMESQAVESTDVAELRMNLRLPPDLSPDHAATWLTAQVPDVDVEILGGLPAWSGPRTTLLHRHLFRSIRKVGGRARYQLKTGTADLNIVAPAWGCPALAYGPGDAALDHTPDEHMVLDEYLRGIQVIEGLLAAADQISS
ncbi:MAG: acetyl-lysine deacetylase [Planctomycetes bacterium]|nr:acetyl-lysine deacetylase [Planctomycetota bacterium]